MTPERTCPSCHRKFIMGTVKNGCCADCNRQDPPVYSPITKFRRLHKLIDYREKLGLTQHGLAQRWGTTQTMVALVETGHKLCPDTWLTELRRAGVRFDRYAGPD